MDPHAPYIEEVEGPEGEEGVEGTKKSFTSTEEWSVGPAAGKEEKGRDGGRREQDQEPSVGRCKLDRGLKANPPVSKFDCEKDL